MKRVLWLSICVLTMAVTNANAELRAYWNFNEGTGTFVNDQSSYANDGTIVMSNGFARVTGKYGQALQFSSATSQGGVEVPDSASLDLTNSFTIMAWVNPDAWDNGGMIIVKEDPDTSEVSFRLFQESFPGGKFGFTAFNSSGSAFAQLVDAKGFTPGQWIHIAVTFDGSQFKFYQNGLLADSVAAGGSLQVNNAALHIGDTEKNGDPFNGKIDEARIYNQALTPAGVLIAMSVEGIGGGAVPVGDAGQDLSKPANTSVQLDGSGSHDPDGTIQRYLWTRVPDGDILCFDSVPQCSTTTLGRAAEVIQLNVVDNAGNTGTDTMTIFYQAPAPPVCGNGTVELGETCDSNSQSCTATGGYPGTQVCNTQCTGFQTCVAGGFCGDSVVNGSEVCDNSSIACTVGAYAGSKQCNSTCSGYNTCVATQSCGDSIVNGGEVCDNSAQACTTAQGYAGSKQCNATCSGYNACVATQSCGDSIVNGNEVCDGSSQACTTAQGYAGLKQCNATCTGYNTCVSSQSCGDHIINGNEVCDGNSQSCTLSGGGSGTASCKTDCSGFDACAASLYTDYTKDIACVAAWNLDDQTLPLQDLCGSNVGTPQAGNMSIRVPAHKDLGVEFYGPSAGNNARVNFGSAAVLDNLGARTIVAWIKPDTLGGDSRGIILSKNVNDGWTFGLYPGNRLVFSQAFSGGTIYWLSPTNSIQLGQFQHVAVTYAGSNTSSVPKMYINGIQQTVTSLWGQTPFGSFDNDAGYTLFMGIEDTIYEFDGIIDETAIFRREFSLNEIKEIMDHGLQGSGASAPDNRPRLMPLGASITAGTGDSNGFGYRDHLQNELGINTYKFVGSFSDPASDPTYQVQHSGIPGNTADQVEARVQGELSTFFNLAPAGSSVLVHVGTNDVLLGTPFQTAIDNIQDVIDIINAHNPSINVYIALLMPVNDSNDAAIVSFNAALKTMLNNYRTVKANLYYVDMHKAFANDTFSLCGGSLSNCMSDTIHPNDTGYNLMAKQWASCMSSPSHLNCNGN